MVTTRSRRTREGAKLVALLERDAGIAWVQRMGKEERKSAEEDIWELVSEEILGFDLH